MLRLSPGNKNRIPNGLAVFAAVLLATSALLGSAPSSQPIVEAAEAAASWLPETPAAGQAPAREAGATAAVKRSKRLKVHLFLLPR